MDEENAIFANDLQGNEFSSSARDENKSPTTTDSSSEAIAEEPSIKKVKFNRKQRRYLKRKRKWKPYTELSWDEKKIKDDRESRRAYAKRERLSAEGHPIAPYNTTQFLMDDRKTNGDSPTSNPQTGETVGSLNNCQLDSNLNSNSQNTNDALTESKQREVTDESGHDHGEDSISFNASHSLRATAVAKRLLDPKRARHFADSPITFDPVGGGTFGDGYGEDIQKYIMNDFSHTYADLHAEQLQSMTKTDLIEECLKLERRVDTLEKRVKDCRRKHKEETYQVNSRLIEKINLLQVQNAQLLKENASIVGQPDETVEQQPIAIPTHGAQTASDVNDLGFPATPQERIDGSA